MNYVTVIISCTKFVNSKDSDDYGYIGLTKYNKVDEDDDEDPSKKVVSETRTERVVMEKGKKKKIIKITKTLADGSKETETIKENVE